MSGFGITRAAWVLLARALWWVSDHVIARVSRSVEKAALKCYRAGRGDA
jgi:hypothetical protein